MTNDGNQGYWQKCHAIFYLALRDLKKSYLAENFPQLRDIL